MSFQESAKIGLVILVIFVLLHVVAMGANPELAMGHAGIFATVFIAGALFPSVADAVGI